MAADKCVLHIKYFITTQLYLTVLALLLSQSCLNTSFSSIFVLLIHVLLPQLVKCDHNSHYQDTRLRLLKKILFDLVFLVILQ